MDVYIKVTVPSHIYRFYNDASQHVAESNAEQVMSDALCAYARLLNKAFAKEENSFIAESGE